MVLINSLKSTTSNKLIFQIKIFYFTKLFNHSMVLHIKIGHVVITNLRETIGTQKVIFIWDIFATLAFKVFFIFFVKSNMN